MRFLFFLFLLALALPQAKAQEFQLLKSYSFNPIEQVSQDRYGNIYVVEQEGVIHQIDSLGKDQLIYSPPMIADITLFEARSTVRLFAFYRDLQSYTLLNRFLTPIESYKFEDTQIRFVRVANLSADNQIWLIDDVDFSIKKFDKNFNNIILRTPLDLLFAEKDYDINYICEYQNQLFLNDRNTGILLFDNLGNFKRKIVLKQGTDYFNFLEEELYFLENEEVRFFHLYTNSERKISLPALGKGKKAHKVLLQKTRIFVFTDYELFIFRIT